MSTSERSWAHLLGKAVPWRDMRVLESGQGNQNDYEQDDQAKREKNATPVLVGCLSALFEGLFKTGPEPEQDQQHNRTDGDEFPGFGLCH